jgi:hypothetical protein
MQDALAAVKHAVGDFGNDTIAVAGLTRALAVARQKAS